MLDVSSLQLWDLSTFIISVQLLEGKKRMEIEYTHAIPPLPPDCCFQGQTGCKEVQKHHVNSCSLTPVGLLELYWKPAQGQLLSSSTNARALDDLYIPTGVLWILSTRFIFHTQDTFWHGFMILWGIFSICHIQHYLSTV